MSTRSSMAKTGPLYPPGETQNVISLESYVPILDVEIDVYAELDRRSIAFGELMSLDIDSLLPLRRSAGEDIDLYVGQTWSGSGEILVVEGRLAIRVADLPDKPSTFPLSAPSGESE